MILGGELKLGGEIPPFPGFCMKPCTVSETRWEIALGSVHTSFKKYGKGEFDDAGADLFGEVFKGELVKKVEADAALSKVVNIANRSSSVKVFQRPT